MSPRRKIFTFAIDADISDQMKEVKATHGIPESEQARRALRLWLGLGGNTLARESLQAKFDKMKAARDATVGPARKRTKK